jgi:hypothetical protein
MISTFLTLPQTTDKSKWSCRDSLIIPANIELIFRISNMYENKPSFKFLKYRCKYMEMAGHDKRRRKTQEAVNPRPFIRFQNRIFSSKKYSKKSPGSINAKTKKFLRIFLRIFSSNISSFSHLYFLGISSKKIFEEISSKKFLRRKV